MNKILMIKYYVARKFFTVGTLKQRMMNKDKRAKGIRRKTFSKFSSLSITMW